MQINEACATMPLTGNEMMMNFGGNDGRLFVSILIKILADASNRFIVFNLHESN